MTRKIRACSREIATPTDAYWNEHTVHAEFPDIRDVEACRAHLKLRSDAYPKFHEYMRLDEPHDGQVVLDYGCGPGYDLVGFALRGRPARIIGVDVSFKALELARRHLAVCGLDGENVELLRVSDAAGDIPLQEASVDFIHCCGVLMHTHRTTEILAEFRRVLRPGGEAAVMVYNYDSLFLHLYTAYSRQIVERAFPGLTVLEAFARNTDGEDCPVSRCFRPEEFLDLVDQSGLEGRFVGGYLSDTEMNHMARYLNEALRHEGLAEEHRRFLREIALDEEGLPLYRGRHAGVGGVYHLRKTDEPEAP
jgi:SAM-dependent methyltransferase